MTNQTFKDIYTEELADGAILNEQYHGFKEDYLVLHCLLRKYGANFKRFFEVGTNIGTGTEIIKNAIPHCEILSLDLPLEESEKSLQYPKTEIQDRVGTAAKFVDYIQLRGDSLTYNYAQHYSIDAWWIDGEHDFEHAYHESKQAFESGAKLIMWHDSDMPEVWRGINQAILINSNYELFRVIDTRIAFALKK